MMTMMTMMIAGSPVCVEIRMPSNEQQKQQQTVVTNRYVDSPPDDAVSVVHNRIVQLTVTAILLVTCGCLNIISTSIAKAFFDYYMVVGILSATAVSTYQFV